eukprot:5188361-Karenia_brevis.AAC.1
MQSKTNTNTYIDQKAVRQPRIVTKLVPNSFKIVTFGWSGAPLGASGGGLGPLVGVFWGPS